jgi:hypothetical protein
MKTFSYFCTSAAALALLLSSSLPATAQNPAPNLGNVSGPELQLRMRSMNNAKQIGTACLLWAEKHEGKFPDQLEDLLAPGYLGPEGTAVLHCPLLHNDSVPGYSYVGRGYRTNGRPETTVLVSIWQDADGKRIVGHGDGSVTFEVSKVNPGGWRSGGTGITGGNIQNPDVRPFPVKPSTPPSK